VGGRFRKKVSQGQLSLAGEGPNLCWVSGGKKKRGSTPDKGKKGEETGETMQNVKKKRHPLGGALKVNFT